MNLKRRLRRLENVRPGALRGQFACMVRSDYERLTGSETPEKERRALCQRYGLHFASVQAGLLEAIVIGNSPKTRELLSNPCQAS